MNSNEIRSRFLNFFQDRGHKVVESSSLVPTDDPTLLFVNAGMNQFKDLFLGQDHRSYSRAGSSQKCVRAGGKHNDLDVVGYTRRHQTFFEMLGNFSFGDYFKKEAIEYAWLLLTDEFALPADRLWVTVFEQDDEADKLWRNHIGLASDRVIRMDEKDNFWQMGETGPCGPCSELHYDFGFAASEEGHADCIFPCQCGRYVEIWNLVFMQFDRDAKGTLKPLPAPSIDTGMGLERIASVLQDKISNYETDLLKSLIDRASAHFGVRYGSSQASDVSLRIIADHARAATFLISDGIIPANEGRGYVLRKIMRRGIRQGTLLGRAEPFLHMMSGHVVELMKTAFPELVNTREYVGRVIESEEQRFSDTVAVAIGKLEEVSARLASENKNVIPGSDIFKLYDTYGLPLDFTEEIARERSLTLDTEGFNNELELQRKRARESWKGGRSRALPIYEDFAKEGPSIFLGYETTQSDGRIVAILLDGKMLESIEDEGRQVEIVLDQTPFYAESGGQVGDVGTLTSTSSASRVLDTQSPVPGLIVHRAVLDFGTIAVGDEIVAQVDAERRKQIAANHTGTHLLHAILRNTLGVHIKQSGSLVDSGRLRFDYAHYAPLTNTEIREIEERINRIVLANYPVQTKEMGLNEAVESGAIAFFGEKYQQTVRVVSIQDLSMELCGGTHTRMTGDIGLFKIVAESSIAAGVRRLEALTGFGSYERLEKSEHLLTALSDRLRAPRSELLHALDKVLEQQKELEHKLAKLKQKDAKSKVQELLRTLNTVSGVQVIAQRVEDIDTGMMRELAETSCSKMGSGIIALGTTSNGKAMLVIAVSEDLRDQLHAGAVIKRIAKLVGGSGGGRPDFAQAGGKEPEKLDQALQEVYNIVSELGV